MSPLFYVSQLEVLVANQAPVARVQMALEDLRRQLELMEIELDRFRRIPVIPQVNTTTIPVVFGPDPKVSVGSAGS
jgi:hypothetical protein